jgi:hypothetical protein
MIVSGACIVFNKLNASNKYIDNYNFYGNSNENIQKNKFKKSLSHKEKIKYFRNKHIP